jgi:hypothetical protein
MEDLIPFLIFLVVVAINVIKFFAKKGKPKKPAQQPGPNPAQAPRFFPRGILQILEEQVAPKPTDLPEWPEDRERPDYLQEMDEFEQAQAEALEEEQTAEIIPMPPPIEAGTAGEPEFRPLEKPATVQAPLQTTKSVFSGAQGMRMPCMNPFNHNATPGHTDFSIKGRKHLKQAMLAHFVFSPPRAFDLSFDNTIAKQG